MALREIIILPDKRLREISKPVAEVTSEIRKLADDMFESMYEAPGIGLAAIQIAEPVRLITTFPSADACMLAVSKGLGVRTFEELVAKKPALKLSVREQHDHCLHMVLEHLTACAGFSTAQLKSWGGELRADAGPRLMRMPASPPVSRSGPRSSLGRVWVLPELKLR